MNSSSSSWVVRTGKADEMKDRIARYKEVVASSSATISRPPIRNDGEAIVELNEVSVSYHERKVSIPCPALSIAGYTFLRYCKTPTGRCERAKGGTSRDQTVRSRGFVRLYPAY